MNNRFDLLEILFKSKIGIPLTDFEKRHLDAVDSDTKKIIYELIDSGSYADELIHTLNSIVEKSESLPKEQREYITCKCEKEIQHLLFPSNNIYHDRKQVK